MTRRIGAFAALCVSLGLLTGCWGAPALDRQGLVSILGIDAAPQGYRVTVDMVNATGLPPPTGGQGGSSPNPVLVRTTAAETVPQALGRIAATTQMSLDLTHLQVVVVSEEAARRGLGVPLEFLDRSGESTVTAWLFVVRAGTAEGLLEASKSVPPQPGLALLETGHYSLTRADTYPNRLLDFLVRMSMAGDNYVTAGLTVDHRGGNGQQDSFRMRGIALFRGERLVGWMDEYAALGWLLLTGHGMRQTVAIPSPLGTFAVELLQSRRSVALETGPHGPWIRVVVRVKGRLVTEPPKGLDLSATPRSIQYAESEAARKLLSDTELALVEGRRAGTDVFGFGQEVRVFDPQLWHRESETWDEKGFAALPVQVEVRYVMALPGNTLCPLAKPCGNFVTRTS